MPHLLEGARAADQGAGVGHHFVIEVLQGLQRRVSNQGNTENEESLYRRSSTIFGVTWNWHVLNQALCGLDTGFRPQPQLAKGHVVEAATEWHIPAGPALTRRTARLSRR